MTSCSSTLLCCRCGYNLIGLPSDGRCSECGESVVKSRDISNRLSIPVRKHLAAGALLIMASHLPLAISSVLGLIHFPFATQAALNIHSKPDLLIAANVALLGQIVSWIGCLIYTKDKHISLHARDVRLAVHVQIGIVVLAIPLSLVSEAFLLGAAIAYLGAMMLKFLGLLSFTSHVALTLEDQKTANRCRQLIWLGILLHCAGLAFTPCSLIAIWLQCRIFWRIRRLALEKTHTGFSGEH